MAKTFEALMKAEKESQKKLTEVTAFESRPPSRPLQRVEATIPKKVKEEYQRIKYNILRLNSGKGIKAILFAGPTEGERNSMVIINFAMMLASEGERVLLVDANLKNPSFHQVFNLQKRNGLAELFLDKSPLENVIQKTRFDNLGVITCGKASSSPSSIFRSPSVGTHIEKMKTQADWILFEAPPIHSAEETVALATKVDGVVMVVEAEKTRWEVAASAKQRIENGDGTILGVVLNNRRLHIPEWIYKTL